jgi:hypothetical protein
MLTDAVDWCGDGARGAGRERKPLLTLLDAGDDMAEKLEEWCSPLSFSAIALSGAAGDDHGAQFMNSRGRSHGLTRSRPVSICRSW